MTHNAVLAVISLYLLAEKWPCCFSIIESGRRPLKLGAFGDICWAASAHNWTWQILPDYPIPS
jgi:sRNA-binding protein